MNTFDGNLFDLMSAEGLRSAQESINSVAKIAGVAVVGGMVSECVPAVQLASLISSGAKAVLGGIFDHPEKMLDQQRKSAIEIIKAGKMSGAKKVRVKLNQKAGVDIGAELQGYALKVKLGPQDSMVIEAEY